jgi:hypothetical protein
MVDEKKAVFRIVTKEKSSGTIINQGTGFFIRNDIIITAGHVVPLENDHIYSVYIGEKCIEELSAQNIKYHKHDVFNATSKTVNDVAILQLKLETSESFLTLSDTLLEEENIIFVGYAGKKYKYVETHEEMCERIENMKSIDDIDNTSPSNTPSNIYQAFKGKINLHSEYINGFLFEYRELEKHPEGLSGGPIISEISKKVLGILTNGGGRDEATSSIALSSKYILQ